MPPPRRTPRGTARRAPSRIGRLLRWLAGGLLGALITVYVVAPLALRSALPSLLAGSGVAAEVERVGIDLASARLTLAGLRLRTAGGIGMRWETVEIDVDPRRLLAGQLRIEALRFAGASVERTATVPPPASAGGGGAPPEIGSLTLEAVDLPLAGIEEPLRLRRMVLADLGAVLGGGASALEIDLRLGEAPLRLRGRLRRDGDALELEGALDAAGLDLGAARSRLAALGVSGAGGRLFAAGDLRLRYQIGSGALKADYRGGARLVGLAGVIGRLRLTPAELRWRGALGLGTGPGAGLDGRLEGRIEAPLLALEVGGAGAPLEVRIGEAVWRGELALGGEAGFEGRLALDRVSLRPGARAAPWTGLEASGVTLDRVAGDFGGGAVLEGLGVVRLAWKAVSPVPGGELGELSLERLERSADGAVAARGLRVAQLDTTGGRLAVRGRALAAASLGWEGALRAAGIEAASVEVAGAGWRGRGEGLELGELAAGDGLRAGKLRIARVLLEQGGEPGRLEALAAGRLRLDRDGVLRLDEASAGGARLALAGGGALELEAVHLAGLVRQAAGDLTARLVRAERARLDLPGGEQLILEGGALEGLELTPALAARIDTLRLASAELALLRGSVRVAGLRVARLDRDAAGGLAVARIDLEELAAEVPDRPPLTAAGLALTGLALGGRPWLTVTAIEARQMALEGDWPLRLEAPFLRAGQLERDGSGGAQDGGADALELRVGGRTVRLASLAVQELRRRPGGGLEIEVARAERLASGQGGAAAVVLAELLAAKVSLDPAGRLRAARLAAGGGQGQSGAARWQLGALRVEGVDGRPGGAWAARRAGALRLVIREGRRELGLGAARARGLELATGRVAAAELELEGLRVAGGEGASLAVPAAELATLALVAGEGLELERARLRGLALAFGLGADGGWRWPELPRLGASAGGAARLRVGRAELTGSGTLTFFDDSLDVPHALDQRIEVARLSGLETTSIGARAQLELRTTSGVWTQEISAELVTAGRGEFDLEIKARLRGVDLPALSPYARSRLGVELTGGRGDVDLELTVVHGELEGRSRLVLSRPRLRPAATAGAALAEALRMLADRRGTVALEIPISGRLDDPEFDLGDAYAQAMTKAATTALMLYLQPVGLVLAAKGLLDKAAAGTLRPVLFSAGEETLDAPALGYLDEVARRLLERPGLALKVCGVAVAADGEALAAAAEAARARGESLAARPLEALAAARAAAVRDYLVTRHGVAPAQLPACAPQVESDGIGRVELPLAGSVQAAPPAPAVPDRDGGA